MAIICYPFLFGEKLHNRDENEPFGIGFTGTRNGMNKRQREVCRNILIHLLLKGRGDNVLHHGDCIGSDEQAHIIARSVNARIVIHPPRNRSFRAFCQGAVKVLKVEDYLERNKYIVDQTTALIAAPKTKVEERRSGTWATVRYARLKSKPIYFIFPDSSVYLELPE